MSDPEALEKKTGKPHTIHGYLPSPDGSLVAYGLSSQGSEAAVVHLLDTRTGKPVGQPMSRADFGGVLVGRARYQPWEAPAQLAMPPV